MLVNLVKNLNKSCSSDIIWNAILGILIYFILSLNLPFIFLFFTFYKYIITIVIGATDQYLRHHISELLYVAICDELRVSIMIIIDYYLFYYRL